MVHSGAVLLLGLTCYIALGLYWDRCAAHNDVPADGKLSASAFALLYMVGALSCIAVAFVDYQSAHKGAFELALVGVPYLVPLGPIVLGGISTFGCFLLLRLLGRQPNISVFYSFCAIGIICFGLTYLGLYGDPVFFRSYSPTIIESGKSALWLGREGLHTAFAGPAPWPAITPVVQLAGFVFGAILFLLIEYPTCAPWSRRPGEQG
jgi:hypothetical protein